MTNDFLVRTYAADINWSANDAISIALMVFALAGNDASSMESDLPEAREDYELCLTNRIDIAKRLTPLDALELLTDCNAHEACIEFKKILNQ